MGIERYLCVGGVEVANPNRTLAYLRNLGNPCLPNPPSLACACPSWQQTAEDEIACFNAINLNVGIVGFDAIAVGAVDTAYPPYGWEFPDCPPPEARAVSFAWSTLEYAPGSTKPDTIPHDSPGWVELATGLPWGSTVPVPYPDGVHPFLLDVVMSDGQGVPIAEAFVFFPADLEPGDWGTGGVWGGGSLYGEFEEGVTGFWSNFAGPASGWSIGVPFQVPFTIDVPVPYTTPAEDDAPWYDPTVPESADVLGVWVEEARLSVPWNRTMRQALRGGSLSPGSLGGRELAVVGWVYTRSPAATAYARQWLFEALAGDGCEGQGCDLPDAEVWTHCPCGDADPENGRRFLKRVGLTSFDPEVEPEFPRACGFKFEATLSAEVPELFLPEVELVTAASLLGPEPVCNICNPCPEPTAPCSCDGLTAAPRVVQQPDGASLFCTPLQIVRTAYQFDPPNLWRDGTLIIRVSAGQYPANLEAQLRNLRIRGWANPAGIDPADAALMECQEPCIDLELGCVPPRSDLVIDGTTRRAIVVCGGEEQNGYAYLSSGGGHRFQWPDVSCYGLLLVVDADPFNTPADASLSVELVLRERG